MRKKLTLQRNIRKGGGPGAPYQKYLVIAAVCLIFLVLVADHFFKAKPKDITKTPLPERVAITKELPRQPEQSPPERLSELTKSDEQGRPAETEPAETPTQPEGIKTADLLPAPRQPTPSPATPQRPFASEAPPEVKAPSAPSAKFEKPAPKDLFPKKGAPSEALTTAALKTPAKPATKTANPSTPAKPAPSMEKGGYAVQVGAIFKDKSLAESARKDLAAKGYSALVRTAAGGGYLVTTNPCPESKAYTLQEQMRIQGLSNTKVIKVAPAPQPHKPVLEKQAVGPPAKLPATFGGGHKDLGGGTVLAGRLG
jgi:cell division protein FtsN